MLDYLVSFLSRYLYAFITITIVTSAILLGVRFLDKREYNKRTEFFLSSLVTSFLITLAVLVLCFAHWSNIGFWQFYHITCEYVTLSLTHTLCTAFVLVIGIAFSFAFMRGIANYYLGEKIITRLYRVTDLARPEAEKQYKILEELAQTAKMKIPKVGLIDSGRPSIFSLGRKEKSIIVLSVGLLESLSDHEIEAAFAHEIAHIKNKDCLIKALASSFNFAVPFNFLGFFVEAALSRDREFLADSESVKLTKKPRALISTLMKLHKSFTTAYRSRFLACMLHSALASNLHISYGKMSAFNYHPSVEERVKRLLDIEKNWLKSRSFG